MLEVARAFLFADLSGFTALTETHGDLDAATIATRFAEIARGTLVAGSRLVKTIGDEVMIACEAPGPAVQVALRLRRVVEEEALFPALRAGIHVGPCIERDDGDYFGATVNVAARVAAYARSGQVLCTEEVAQNVHGFPELELRSAGFARFKNVREPVALWEVMDAERAVSSDVVDPVCRMRVDPATTQARLSLDGVDHYFCSLDCLRVFTANPQRHRSR